MFLKLKVAWMSVLFIELLNGGGSSLLYLASILYWRSALAMVSTPMNKKSNKCCMLLQSRLHHFQVDTKDFCGGVNIVFVYQFLHISNHKRKYFSVLISYAVFLCPWKPSEYYCNRLWDYAHEACYYKQKINNHSVPIWQQQSKLSKTYISSSTYKRYSWAPSSMFY